MREEGILDAVLGDLTELRGVPLDEPREHLFCRHVDLLIVQVQLRHVVQGIRIQLIPLLDLVKEIEYEPPGHGQ